MSNSEYAMHVLGVVVVASPLLMTAIMGLASLIGFQLSERTTSRLGYFSIGCGLAAAVAILTIMLIVDDRHVEVELGDWVVLPNHLYHFSVSIVFDRLSVPFTILSYVLLGTIGAFASQYLHREPGYNRFFTLYWIFVLGMVLTAVAGTIETLFAGWEFVGLSSVLLVAFFQERPAPPRSALWVWIVYRVSDAALLLAAVAMHHLKGEGHFNLLLGSGFWPYEHPQIAANQALVVGLLLLVAAAGKSGLVPVFGLAAARMEGPTPSSAVFYGALSVHLGAFLLLRMGPLIAVSLPLMIIVTTVGVATAIFSRLAAGVQSDIKSALSFAALTQVGIIVAEIGLGFRYVALVHLLGHACLRTLQFVRAPSLLQDYRTLENAIGEHLPLGRLKPHGYRMWLYRWSLERGYLDELLRDYIVGPFVRVFSWCDGLERRWTDFLSRGPSRDSDQTASQFVALEELP